MVKFTQTGEWCGRGWEPSAGTDAGIAEDWSAGRWCVMSGRKRSRLRVTRWFAPPSGGYHGTAADGNPLVREGLPPKAPATPEGVRRMRSQSEGRK